jgi:hypothetical protein
MLRSVEITGAVAGSVQGEPSHDLHWQKKLEISLDCFVCERAGRTTVLLWGAERGICSADDEQGQHFAPARISAFDHTSRVDELALRAVVDHWWAPFHDGKRDQAALPLGRQPWVRLWLGYYCRQQGESGEYSIQSNMVRPVTLSCKYCGVAVATSGEAPNLRLVV